MIVTSIVTTLVLSALPDIPSYDAEGYAVGKQGDRFGYQITSGDLDGDGNLDLVVTAPHQTGGNRAYVFLGPIDLASDPVLEAGQADVTIVGPAGSETGWAVVVGDLIGDGTDDLIVAAASEVSGRGRLHLFQGPLPQSSTIDTAIADHHIDGVVNGGALGWALSVGDYDGDGHDELGAGACNVGAGLLQGIGEAYLFDFDGATLPSTTADATATFKGVGRSGCAMGTADFNGDNFDELLIGSYGESINSGRSWGGSVALVYGRTQFDSSYSLRDGNYEDLDIALIVAENTGNSFGFDIASDDLDRDGYADLIVGAPAKECRQGCTGWDTRGRTYVIPGGPDQGSHRILAGISRANDVADVIYESPSLADELGRAVAAGGYAGATFNRINHPLAPVPLYGPTVLVGSGNDEGWALAYDAGARLEVPPQYQCTYNQDIQQLSCTLEPVPKDPRQHRIDLGAMTLGGHRFYGDAGQAFGLEVHAADLDGDGGNDFVFGATHQFEFEDPAGDGEAFIFQGH